VRVRVSFRVNTETGEVERFQVDDLGTSRQVEHDAEHEEIAHRIGSLIERRPDVYEVIPGSAADERAAALVERPAEQEAEDSRITQQELESGG
jgi:hypothetical protein